MGFLKKVVTTAIISGGLLGALALINKNTEDMAGELDTILTGEERRYPWKYGDIFYEVKGAPEAKPLVFIHGFGPGASSYEWRKNIDALSENFRVFALDLLGFGLSDRPQMEYDAEIYTDLISDFMRDVVDSSSIVVAHGTTGAYVIAAANRYAQFFEHLVLVSPSPSMLEESYSALYQTVVKKVLGLPIIGQSLYNLLTSRQTIRSFYDQRGYHNPGLITDELVEYIYTSAHQRGSRFVVASLFGNCLHLDVREPLARLQMPVTIVWGRESFDILVDASSAFTCVNKRVMVHIIDKCRHNLQEEQANQLNIFLLTLSHTPIK